jgi:hypothetical protein
MSQGHKPLSQSLNEDGQKLKKPSNARETREGGGGERSLEWAMQTNTRRRRLHREKGTRERKKGEEGDPPPPTFILTTPHMCVHLLSDTPGKEERDHSNQKIGEPKSTEGIVGNTTQKAHHTSKVIPSLLGGVWWHLFV